MHINEIKIIERSCFCVVDIKSEYETLAKAIEKSDEIVIIGGGPVGVEMAGEIVDRYKDKKIHLRLLIL